MDQVGNSKSISAQAKPTFLGQKYFLRNNEPNLDRNNLSNIQYEYPIDKQINNIETDNKLSRDHRAAQGTHLLCSIVGFWSDIKASYEHC